jgi:hypothetical protein
VSLLRDAGMVAAAVIAGRPVAWTLIAGGTALLIWERSRTGSFVCPAAWIVAAVLVTAIAFTAVVRERRGLPVMLAVVAVFAAVVGKRDDPTTPMTVAGAGAIAATLLLHGSPRALRIAGGLALALGCTFALWRAGWRTGEGGFPAGNELGMFRLAGLRQEVVIAAGIAMLTPVVRPGLAAGVVIGAALVVAIDYVAAFDRPVTNVVHALVLLGAVSCAGAAVRMSGAGAADGDRALGRLDVRLQRRAWIAAFVAACVVVGSVGWRSVLHRLLAHVDHVHEWWATGAMIITWAPAVKGVAAACLGGICARMCRRGAVARAAAAFALASIVVAAGEWTFPSWGSLPAEALSAVTTGAALIAPAFIAGAAISTYAPAWRRSTVIKCLVAVTLCVLVVCAGLLYETGAWVDRMPPSQRLLTAVFPVLWGAIAALAAAARFGRPAIAASAIVLALVTEIATKGALALAPAWDIPFAPDWVVMGAATAYSLCWIFILRAFCARTPVPEEHPIHRDFDVLSRET